VLRVSIDAERSNCHGLSGCEERVAYEKSVDVEDDKVKSKETTVTETPEGNIRVEEKRTTEEYDDGQLKKETETETRTVPR
jgi:hypothetical protein